MERKIFLYPEARAYSIPELEKQLAFRYLSKNSYETLKSRSNIQSKGLKKWKNGEVSQKSVELGETFSQEIQSGYLPLVSLGFISEEVGYGLFAEEEIKVGSFVGEYTGIVRENNRRYLEPLNNYCYQYPVADAIGRDFVIDATDGNLTRFINHSSQPNLKAEFAFLDGFYHCIFTALQAIPKGSQLTYNYGVNYWYIRPRPKEI